MAVAGSLRGLRCANELCMFFVHPNFRLGGFCCRKCHQCYEEQRDSTEHGGSCYCCGITAPEWAVAALPMAPLDSLVAPVRAGPFVPSASVEPITPIVSIGSDAAVEPIGALGHVAADPGVAPSGANARQ